MPPFHRQNLTGLRFGRWTVLRPDDQATRDQQQLYRSKGSRATAPAFWVCRCACGQQKSVRSHGLLSGTSQSCGCLRNEQRTARAAKRRQNTNEEDFC